MPRIIQIRFGIKGLSEEFSFRKKRAIIGKERKMK